VSVRGTAGTIKLTRLAGTASLRGSDSGTVTLRGPGGIVGGPEKLTRGLSGTTGRYLVVLESTMEALEFTMDESAIDDHDRLVESKRDDQNDRVCCESEDLRCESEQVELAHKVVNSAQSVFCSSNFECKFLLSVAGK